MVLWSKIHRATQETLWFYGSMVKKYSIVLKNTLWSYGRKRVLTEAGGGLEAAGVDVEGVGAVAEAFEAEVVLAVGEVVLDVEGGCVYVLLE